MTVLDRRSIDILLTPLFHPGRFSELTKEAKCRAASDVLTRLCASDSATILYRPDQPYEDVKKLAKRISLRAISLEGTSSGEHGVVSHSTMLVLMV